MIPSQVVNYLALALNRVLGRGYYSWFSFARIISLVSGTLHRAGLARQRTVDNSEFAIVSRSGPNGAELGMDAVRAIVRVVFVAVGDLHGRGVRLHVAVITGNLRPPVSAGPP